MIEQSLYGHLTAQEILTPYLTKYAGKLAVFNQEAPDDTDSGWEEDTQYGRVVYAVKHVSDPQRGIVTTLSVDYMCKEGVAVPEDVEPILRQLIDGYFFSTEEITMSARWNSSDYFNTATEQIIGVTLIFQLMAFPVQETTYPDPIKLLNSWSNDENNGLPKILGGPVRVIGTDNMPQAWKPSASEPALYWRLGKTRQAEWIPDTYNCNWYKATIQGHVLGAEIAHEVAVARLIAQHLTIKKRLIFDDDSPLMIDSYIQINPEADQLRVGQITLDATYGVLNKYQVDGSSSIRNINLSRKEKPND